MATLRYAGIGARATPAAVLADMTVMAAWLARTGWHLAGGGADGADSAFAAGAPAGQRTIWLPWQGYNGHRGPDYRVLSASALWACMMEIVTPLHPAWDRCSPAVRKLHARNAAILLSDTVENILDGHVVAPVVTVVVDVDEPLRAALDHGAKSQTHRLVDRRLVVELTEQRIAVAAAVDVEFPEVREGPAHGHLDRLVQGLQRRRQRHVDVQPRNPLTHRPVPSASHSLDMA